MIATSPRWGVIVATAGLCAVTIVGPIAQTTTRPSRKHVLAWLTCGTGINTKYYEALRWALRLVDADGRTGP